MNNQKIRIKHQGKENRIYTIHDYNKVILLRKKGISYPKIAKIMNISSATVQLWIKTSRKPRYIYAEKQQRQIKSSSKSISNDLAYIYGVLIGDGTIEKSKYNARISLSVVDKEFANKFYKILKKWSGLKPTRMESYRLNNWKTKYGNLISGTSHFYWVRLGSKQAVDFLLSKLKCRTYIWEVPKEIRKTNKKEIIFSFLKGIFDSEGYPVISGKRRNRRVELEMYSSSVKQIQDLLKKVGINSTVTQGKKQKERNMYILRILRKDDIVLFAENIGFIISRKRIILSRILHSYTK